MDDQAPGAVESDLTERMTEFLDSDEGDPTGDEPENAEPEAEEPEPSEEPEEEAPPAEEFEEITHNGEVKKLSKTELKELAQQGFDYTQKTQQLAETRRYLEQQEQAIQQQAQLQAQFTDQIAAAKALESQLAQWKSVNWSELAQTDPMQYLSLHHQYTEAKDAFQSQMQNLSLMQQQAQEVAQQQRAQRLQMEAQAMKQAIPEWKDQTRASAEMGELKTFLSSAGFAPAEVDGVTDHRHVVIARKAMLYDKLMASGKQKVATAPSPTAKPGSAAKPKSNETQKLRDSLKRTGRGEYAAELIARTLK